jgi:predicted type IV restriction endonuclease
MKRDDFVKQFNRENIDQTLKRSKNRKVEENIKVNLVVPILTKYLESNYHIDDLDYEHNANGKRIDIAITQGVITKIIIEVKDESNINLLKNSAIQAYDYARDKGTDFFIITNGVIWFFYAQYIPGVVNLNERLIYQFNIFDNNTRWTEFQRLLGRTDIIENDQDSLNKLRNKKQPKITGNILFNELQFAKDLLKKDLIFEFKKKFSKNSHFKNEVEKWALKTHLDIKDKNLIEKLCTEGAYSLINRVLLYRIAECRELLPVKLSKSCLKEWKEMVAKPHKELKKAFNETTNFYKEFFNYPLFNHVKYDDIDWNEKHISEILKRLSFFDFKEISDDIIGAAYEKHLSIEKRKELGQYYTHSYVVDYMLVDSQVKVTTSFSPEVTTSQFLYPQLI